MSVLTELTEQLKTKKVKEAEIKDKYIALDKVKKLTTEQRLKRIEELLNIQ